MACQYITLQKKMISKCIYYIGLLGKDDKKDKEVDRSGKATIGV